MSCSCSQRRLRNLETTVYRASTCCDDNDVNINIIERPCPYPPYPPMPPFPPVPPLPPFPPIPPVPTPDYPSLDYAYFYDTAATGATYQAGSVIPFPTTLANTDTEGIINNNGVLTLSGGTEGRTYRIDYNVAGTFTGATLALVVNGANAPGSGNTINGTTTARGNYYVTVPANTTSTVSLNVIAGTVATSTPTTGTNLSVLRID